MGVVWSFMGASAAYTVFSGLAEVTGGVLLFFRRTTALGALVTFGVMTNVVALNYCYDISVKLNSTHFLLMSAFLLAPDFQRLVNVFLLNRAAEPADFRLPTFRTGWPLWASRGVWAIVFALGVIANGVDAYKKYAAPKPRSPLYGLYAVESETPDGWYRMAFDTPDSFTIRGRDGRPGYYQVEYDVAKQMFTIKNGIALRWSRQDGNVLLLTGTVGGKETTIRLRRIDETLLLRTRGFHWVQEYPFNR
jgi:hypothetical protein